MTMDSNLLTKATRLFRSHFGVPHAVAAYAPGRVEVLGNHTDYNEGFVLSAAINLGTFFLAAPAQETGCRLVAGDIMEEVSFDADNPTPSRQACWSNYVKGVLSGLNHGRREPTGFLGLFLGNVPLGAGLSSSAALEMASGKALCEMYGIEVDPIALARIGQKAEHEFAGVKCGLLDQISSLFGKENMLVMSDFRSLEVENVPLGADACFLMCNTSDKHALVDGAYNERRQNCEQAARFFASVLDHPVTALRDVSWAEWQKHSGKTDPLTARRAAHPIGENERVLKGRELLRHGKLEEFGRLMFESHRSSREYFENSCRKLDFLVATAEKLPGVLGARLSGGGFGGSAVMLIHPRDVETVRHAVATAYRKEFGHPCDIRVITPSGGARVIAGGC
jgi:galactokinase